MSVAGVPLLAATGLVKRYGGLVAIDHVDIALAPGSITGVIGPNGAGKSTLIGLIGGALTPSQGSIRLEGRDVSRMSASDRARAGIGRTYQIPRPFLDMTVEENLEVAQYSVAPLIRGEVARSERQALLERTGLSDAAHLPARALPLLRRKRLEVARALALKPRVVLLDEVGAGLVDSEIAELIALIKSILDPRTAIVIVEHVIRVVRECCARSLVLNFGKMLVEGATAEILANDEVASVYLGTHGARDKAAIRTHAIDLEPGAPGDQSSPEGREAQRSRAAHRCVLRRRHGSAPARASRRRSRLRPGSGAQGRRPDRRGGRGYRNSWRERRGKDDACPRHQRRDSADRRLGAHRGP